MPETYSGYRLSKNKHNLFLTAKEMKAKGYLLAALAAATYGTNPAFAVPLYEDGMNACSVLLFRYVLGLPILAAMIFARGRNLRLPKGSLLPVATLGILMGLSSLSLFESYNYMNSGIASTLLFIYPIMVAVIMMIFYREKFKAVTALCLVLMSGGVALLAKTSGGVTLSTTGILLVMASALTYALYIVIVNVSSKVKGIPTTVLLFYQLLFGSLVFVIPVLCGTQLTMPPHWYNWINVVSLAVLPTVISLTCTTLAIQYVGATPTAILGALEPVTAVVLSVVILDQGLTAREVYGGLLIVVATTLVIASDPIEHLLLRVRKMFPPLRKHRQKG